MQRRSENFESEAIVKGASKIKTMGLTVSKIIKFFQPSQLKIKISSKNISYRYKCN